MCAKYLVIHDSNEFYSNKFVALFFNTALTYIVECCLHSFSQLH